MNKDTVWNIVLLVSLLLLAHGLLNMGDTDKKTAQAAQGESAAGGLGVVSYVFKKNWYWAALAAVSSIPFLWSNFKNMFTDGPTIPTWAWVVGAVLLFLMIARMGRK